MRLAQPHPECSIHQAGEYVRADVGSRRAEEIQECYRTAVTVALEHKFQRMLVIGVGTVDSHSHLAARDAVIAMHVIGVPAGFRIAFVPKSDVTLNAYRHAEIEAQSRGLRAKVFEHEEDAVRWLIGHELH
jgi:hypothetical protein